MLRHRNIIRMTQLQVKRLLSSSGTNPSNSGNGKTPSEEEDKHPIRRTFRLLGNDMRKIKEFFVPKEDNYDGEPRPLDEVQKESKVKKEQPDEFQTHCDVLIIGGGGIGSSTAYWLKQRARNGLNVVVVEKDETYKKSSTCVAIGGLCQQFALPENIQMSLFGADFLRGSADHFGTDIPLHYTPHGQLLLASEKDAEALKKTSDIQNELGARNELLTPDRLATRFPWLNTKDVALGCVGLEREGWFDPWALLTNLRRAATGFGAHYVHGEAVEFEFKAQSDIIVTGDATATEGGYQGLDKVVVQLADGTKRSIKFAICVIAAGVDSAAVSRLAHIGQGTGLLRVPLPIEARQRYLYVINSQEQNTPLMSMPMVADTSGIFFRRNGLGGQYVCGHNAEPRSASTDANLTYFESQIQPALVHRVPALSSANVVSSVVGSYDYNGYDESGILGPHPYYHNLYIASGFSGQGIQQAPAVGRAIAELIMDGQFRTLDLSRLSFDRLLVDKPMYECNAFN